MEQYYLAVDIGASSGRHILGSVKDGRITLEEIYRFDNGMCNTRDGLCWDAEKLFGEIKTGMKRCREMGKIPVSMGIDTWAVDFVLLDEAGEMSGSMTGYRDGRTMGMDEVVYQVISPEKLYERTGIQKQIFNTIYQMMAIKEKKPELLQKAKAFLMAADYFHFLLTGKKLQEYTNATTTQLVSPHTKDWDYELIGMLGYPKEWFHPLSMPGTVAGELKEEIQKEVGFNCQVVLPATHDTGSAVLAVPSNQEDILYISSGTWSLMGTEQAQAICTRESMELNFTNEGGYDFRFRFLKNIMGLWMIQSVRKEWKELGFGEFSYQELCRMASMEDIATLVDCNDERFLAPASMIGAIGDFCMETGQKVPVTPGEMAAVIYNSLAMCYKKTLDEIEQITGKQYPFIHIVGGGANADYLNQLTAGYTKRTVFAGPAEATAIGNLIVQMIKAGEFGSLKEARAQVFKSFDIKTYPCGPKEREGD